MLSFKTYAAAPALLAAFSMTAMPVQAAELPAPVSYAPAHAAPAWVPGDDTADQYRRYRHRRHRGVDGGDILAGILILGGIAAVAGAAKGSRDRYPRRDARYPDPRRGDYRYNERGGIDRAVSMCVSEIERNARVETVDSVNRDAGGWNVSGSLYDGQAFSCSIGEDGRIGAIDYGQGQAGHDAVGNNYQAEAAPNRQHSGDYYAAARARTGDAQPAYPGGPLPGEEIEQPGGDIEYGTEYPGSGT